VFERTWNEGSAGRSWDDAVDEQGWGDTGAREEGERSTARPHSTGVLLEDDADLNEDGIIQVLRSAARIYVSFARSSCATRQVEGNSAGLVRVRASLGRHTRHHGIA
jgi:hypothetical protein